MCNIQHNLQYNRDELFNQRLEPDSSKLKPLCQGAYIAIYRKDMVTGKQLF